MAVKPMKATNEDYCCPFATKVWHVRIILIESCYPVRN